MTNLGPKAAIGRLAPLGPWFLPRRRFSISKTRLGSLDLAGVVQVASFAQRTQERAWDRRGEGRFAPGPSGGVARMPGAHTSSPSLSPGAVARSSRSGAEPRASLGAGERPGSSTGALAGSPTAHPAARTLTRPRPPAAASGGRSARRGAPGCAAPPLLRAGGGTDGPGGRERKPERPAGEELHATGGRPGRLGLGLRLFVGGSRAASADGPEAAALSWQAEGCLLRPPARRGPRMRGGDARGQGRALSPGAAAAGRALCSWGPGARQLPGFHLPPAGPRQTPAPRPR